MQPPIPSPVTALARKTDDWFQRANAALLSQVPCRAGCAHCCIGIFPITRLDVRLLEHGLGELPNGISNRIGERAVRQIAALEAAEPRLRTSASIDGWADDDIDRVVTAFHGARCPALSEDGLCLVYAYRPLTCRSMGIPAREENVVNGACEVQTFVPIVRLSDSLEAEEAALARRESSELTLLPEVAGEGEEILLPYGFVCRDDRAS